MKIKLNKIPNLLITIINNKNKPKAKNKHCLFKNMNAEHWIKTYFPNCGAMDEHWTFQRYDIPEFVRKWIRENWIKINDNNGGTYYKKSYYIKTYGKLPSF